MNTRERGKVWPMVSALVGAFFVLVVVPLILHRQTSARMATVDPNVTIGDGPATDLPARENPSYRWPDSEVPRTAELGSTFRSCYGRSLSYYRCTVNFRR